MFNFIKGNPDELDGKAIIYTRNKMGAKNDAYNPEYISCFVGSDVNAMIEVMESYQIVTDVMKTELTNQYNDAKKREDQKGEYENACMSFIEGGLKSIDINDDVPEAIKELIGQNAEKMMEQSKKKQRLRKIFPSFVIVYNFDPEKIDESCFVGDLIQMTDVPLLDYAVPLITSAVNVYITTYVNQQEDLIVTPDGYTSTMDNFNTMPLADFKQQFTNLFNQLLLAGKTQQDTSGIFTNMKQLVTGTALITDVVNLYKLHSTNIESKDDIVALYCEKIFALADENYEQARTVSDKIKQLSL
jgi:hypothetical protein